MANPVKGEVAFEAAGRPYTLSFSVNALCELEEALGLSVARISEVMGDDNSVSLRNVRALVWAGLRDHHPEVTQVEAGRLIDAVGIAEAVGLVGRAFMLAFPQEDARGSDARRPLGAATRSGRGRTSSRHGASSATRPASSGG